MDDDGDDEEEGEGVCGTFGKIRKYFAISSTVQCSTVPSTNWPSILTLSSLMGSFHCEATDGDKPVMGGA